MDEGAGGGARRRPVATEPKRFGVVDAHVAGETVRLLVEGVPQVAGRTMGEKRSWLIAHAEPLRRMLMLEPRGHAGMHGAIFTQPVSANAHAGLLSMTAGGFPMMSGEDAIAAVTIGIQDRILQVDDDEIRIDTPAGMLTARPRRTAASAAPRVHSVVIEGLEGFVHSAGLAIRFGGRTVLVDVASGGELFAIVDGEAVGTPVDPQHAAELLRVGARLTVAVEAALRAAGSAVDTIEGVIFTAPARTGGDLRTATVLQGGVLRRSPGVTGTVALMAVLDAMGVLDGQTVTHESVIGTTLPARVVRRRTASGIPMVVSEVEGSAWITGRHQFELADDDPLASFEM